MPTIAEKNVLSCERAQAAVNAYRGAHAGGNFNTDDVACIGDLLVDLFHLAEVAYKTAEREEGCEVAYEGAVTVHGLALTSLDHYDYERDPDHADEEV